MDARKVDEDLKISTRDLPVADGPPSVSMTDDYSEPEWSQRDATDRLFKKLQPPGLISRVSMYLCGFFYTPRRTMPEDDFPEYADPASCSDPATPYQLIQRPSTQSHDVVDYRLHKK